MQLALVQRIGLGQLIERRMQSLTISLGKPPLGSQLIIEVIDLLLPRCPAMRPAAVRQKGPGRTSMRGPRVIAAPQLSHIVSTGEPQISQNLSTSSASGDLGFMGSQRTSGLHTISPDAGRKANRRAGSTTSCEMM